MRAANAIQEWLPLADLQTASFSEPRPHLCDDCFGSRIIPCRTGFDACGRCAAAAEADYQGKKNV